MHCHTRVSDAVSSLYDLIAAAESRCVSTVAITDHNTIEYAREACVYKRQLEEKEDGRGVRVIPGIEVSSGIDLGDGVDIVRIIGLGIYLAEEALVSLCNDLREKRLAEFRRRIYHVKLGSEELGVTFCFAL